MIKLYLTYADGLHERTEKVLFEHLGVKPDILRTQSGKPYIAGDPLFFSVSHSGSRGILAVGDRAVGVDLEVKRGRNHGAVIKRFSPRERAEIACEKDFLRHWTAREAFIKLHGYTLAKCLQSLEYYGGNLYLEGEIQDVLLQIYDFGFGIAAVCSEKL